MSVKPLAPWKPSQPHKILPPDQLWRMGLQPGEAVEVIGENGPLPGVWRVSSLHDGEITVSSGPNCFLRFNIRSGRRVTSGVKGWIQPANPAGGG